MKRKSFLIKISNILKRKMFRLHPCLRLFVKIYINQQNIKNNQNRILKEILDLSKPDKNGEYDFYNAFIKIRELRKKANGYYCI